MTYGITESSLGMIRHIAAMLAGLLVAIALIAPARAQEPPAGPPIPAAKGETKPVDTAPALQGPGAPVDSKAYKVGPEDVLYIRVWHETEFSGPVTVHADGKITLPLIGDLSVGGQTPYDIEQVISKSLTKYVVKPLVTVTVQEVRSKKYYLDGEVNRPGEYPLVAPTTILEAISKAGGLHEFANLKKIYILRGTERIKFNYKEVSHGKHMEQNIQLEPGDHVFVP